MNTNDLFWDVWQNRTDDSIVWVSQASARSVMAETCDCVGTFTTEEEARQFARELREMFRDERN